MDLNSITLSPQLLEELYGSVLVDGQTAIAPVTVAAAEEHVAGSDIKFLGDYQKSVLLLVNYPSEAYLPDTELQFLTSILQACKLNLGDVALVNHARHPLPYAELAARLKPAYLLVFGVDAEQLALPLAPLFTVQQQGNCKLIFAPAAENFNGADARALKGKLWTSLKQLFNI